MKRSFIFAGVVCALGLIAACLVGCCDCDEEQSAQKEDRPPLANGLL